MIFDYYKLHGNEYLYILAQSTYQSTDVSI